MFSFVAPPNACALLRVIFTGGKNLCLSQLPPLNHTIGKCPSPITPRRFTYTYSTVIIYTSPNVFNNYRTVYIYIIYSVGISKKLLWILSCYRYPAISIPSSLKNQLIFRSGNLSLNAWHIASGGFQAVSNSYLNIQPSS